ncbi:hypothetical protein PoB_006484300 [Plakobranchus ocellatus]|uniref:Uncharacterized protein n=1 Tax=Plakobranchus ocellatus TaxID=259542 RepID=A0AAV4D2E0_9GAST|nr:hypothetical protein PoB_006484300 [Plakobranchus ocellatus]
MSDYFVFHEVDKKFAKEQKELYFKGFSQIFTEAGLFTSPLRPRSSAESTAMLFKKLILEVSVLLATIAMATAFLNHNFRGNDRIDPAVSIITRPEDDSTVVNSTVSLSNRPENNSTVVDPAVSLSNRPENNSAVADPAVSLSNRPENSSTASYSKAKNCS